MYTVTRATPNEALLWKITVLGMIKTPVGAGTFWPLSIPYCYRKIPEEPRIENVRKICRRFTAWGGEAQD
jgi:hypothetical protein